jgi:RNA polymerase sigma-70 factor (ECF subfamily)
MNQEQVLTPEMQEALAYVDKTERRIIRIVGENDAKDVLQNARLRVWQRFEKDFRGDSKISTWVFRVVINEARGFLRKDRTVGRDRRKTDYFTELETINRDDGSEVMFDCADPMAMNEQTLCLKVDLNQALEKVPPGYRNAIVLNSVLGYTVKEAAVITKTSQGNIKSQHFKGIKRLRENLGLKAPSQYRWLNEKQIRAIFVRRNEKATLSEIGSEFKISRQRVSQILKGGSKHALQTANRNGNFRQSSGAQRESKFTPQEAGNSRIESCGGGR